MSRSLVLLLVLSSLVAPAAAAQTATPVQQPTSAPKDPTRHKESARAAQRAYKAAEEMSSKGDVTGAARLIEAQKRDCAGADDKACRQILDYSLGYLYEQGSLRDEEKRGALLDRAAESYEKVLAESPAHGPTVSNLVSVYNRLGQPERSLPVLRRALAADPAGADRYNLLLGDVCLQIRRTEDALRWYEEALRRNPDDPAPSQRIIATLLQAPKPDPAALLHRGREWEESFPSSAREAYEAAILLAWRTDPELAEETLVQWTGLLARGGSISAADLEPLPEAWDSELVRSLRTYLERPEAGLPSPWTNAPARREAAAQTALALGRNRLAEGEPARAEAILQPAPGLVPVLHPAFLDLQIELATLYTAYRDLDPDGAKLSRTEIDLFGGKGMAYARADQRAIQRYHTALGLLYADRGTWNPDGGARGAIFQLEHALSTADNRWFDEGFYQPLPKVRERLADGYRAVGDTRNAVLAYANAARAYLDTDDLEGARRSLEAARALNGPESELGRLSGILAVREVLARELGEGGMPSAELRQAAEALLAAPEGPEGSSPPRQGFDRRQRFKVLADLALFPAARGAASEDTLAKAETALEAALSGTAGLVGAGDLLRLEKLQAQVAGSVGASVARPEVVPGGSAEKAAGPLLALSLSSESGPARLRVSEDIRTVSKLVSGLGAGVVLDTRMRVRVDGGAVKLDYVAPGKDWKRVVSRAEASLGAEVEVADSVKNQG